MDIGTLNSSRNCNLIVCKYSFGLKQTFETYRFRSLLYR